MKPLKIYLADLVHDYTPCNYVVPLNVGYLAAYLKAQFGNSIEIRRMSIPAIYSSRISVDLK